ncbi:hypothetical protein Q7C36_011994 [Tachysurus vachellii]|uniref:Uncharacterized protein n=1 Tax=Tachysurus vachellii TaxID=175792 RepID=A0AA88MSV6_TACVA|nr:hypothetical protein Q7C36_011994 [Tachysurus vachellii]
MAERGGGESAAEVRRRQHLVGWRKYEAVAGRRFDDAEQLRSELLEEGARYKPERSKWKEETGLTLTPVSPSQLRRCLSAANVRLSPKAKWIILMNLLLGAATNVFVVIQSEDVAAKWLTCCCIILELLFFCCTAFYLMLLSSAVLVTLTLRGVQLERVVIDETLGRLPAETISHGFVKSCCVMKSSCGAWQIIQKAVVVGGNHVVGTENQVDFPPEYAAGRRDQRIVVMRSKEEAVKWLTCFCITFEIVVFICTVLLDQFCSINAFQS